MDDRLGNKVLKSGDRVKQEIETHKFLYTVGVRFPYGPLFIELKTLKNMTSNFIFWAIIAFICFDLVGDIILTALNVSWSKKPIPEILKDVYNKEEYEKQQAYSSEVRKVDVLKMFVSYAIVILFFSLGGYGWLDAIIGSLTSSFVLKALIYYIFIDAIASFTNIFVDDYETFSIEERYGFNNSTVGLFFGDWLKNSMISLILGGGMFMLYAWFYVLTPQWFWLLCFAVTSVVSVLFSYFYSNIIVPLFNEQTPLEDGELRNAIETFAKKVNFQIENIYVLDESKRTTKANAYFTGFGKRKRIVLYDTLIKQLNTDEIVAVLAHEIGHYKGGHTIKDILMSLSKDFIKFFLIYLLIDSDIISIAGGAVSASFCVNWILIPFLLIPISFITSWIENIISRRFERYADKFAKDNGCGSSLASGLKKISAQALSNLTPHPIVVNFEYSHPTLEERVKNML